MDSSDQHSTSGNEDAKLKIKVGGRAKVAVWEDAELASPNS